MATTACFNDVSIYVSMTLGIYLINIRKRRRWRGDASACRDLILNQQQAGSTLMINVPVIK